MINKSYFLSHAKLLKMSQGKFPHSLSEHVFSLKQGKQKPPVHWMGLAFSESEKVQIRQ